MSSFTIEPLVPLLTRSLEEFSVPGEIRVGPYAQVLQCLLSPTSVLHQAGEGIGVLVIRPEDLTDTVQPGSAAEEICAAVRSYRSRSDLPLLVLASEPKADTGRAVGDKLCHGLGGIADVYVIDPATIARRYPCARIHDETADRTGHIPYTRTYFAALALTITRFLWRYRQPEKKVLVLDCDNTLWQGVCGESGPFGVEVDGGARALQSFARAESARGTVVCLASKNVEDDVWDVFANNPDMVLKREDIIDARINWLPKSQNLKAIAAALDLSVDSFVFVDDNPVEIAEVSSTLPGVLPVNWPSGSIDAELVVDHLWALDHLKVTAADGLRVQTYRDNIARSELRAGVTTFAEFIRSLNLDIRISPCAAEDVARVAQLFVRTTQFNAANGRHSEAEVLRLLEQPAVEVLTARVTDRFGDYGLVGVMVLEIAQEQLLVRELLMSCRVLGRGVEHALLRRMAQACAAAGKTLIRVSYSATERNEPMRRFLCSLTHQREGDDFIFAHSVLAAAALPDDEAEAMAPLAVEADSVSASLPQRTSGSVSPALDVRLVHRKALELANPVRLEALLDAVREERPSGLAWVAPKQGIEIELAGIWSNVLRIEPVGRSDPFKALGGTSLDMVRVHRLIFDRLQKDVPLADLLSASTIADVAALIERGRNGEGAMDAARARAAMQRQAVRNVRAAGTAPGRK